jgi:hypothetical protein
MIGLFSPWTQREIDFLGPFAVDHILYDALRIQEHIEVIASNIDSDKIQEDQDEPWGFCVVVVIMKDLFVVADDNAIGGS